MWEALLNFSRAPQTDNASQSLIYFKISNRASVLDILANEEPEQFWAAFLLCPSVTFLPLPVQEGSSYSLANRSFLSTSHLSRALSFKHRYSVTQFLTVSNIRNELFNLCGEAIAGIGYLGEVG